MDARVAGFAPAFTNEGLSNGQAFDSPHSTLAGVPRYTFEDILADPPWRWKAYSAKGLEKSPEKHYPTMAIHDVMRMPVAAIAARDCHLWLWCPGPMVAVGAHCEVMRAWGFTPSSDALVWVKTTDAAMPGRLVRFDERLFAFGQGKTTRKNVEYCFLGRKGAPPRISASIRQLILTPKREHSRKPHEARERIEAYSGPCRLRIELFAREAAPGWSCWGNDTGKFEI